MAEHHDQDRPLNLELIGYDELNRLPTIGRVTDHDLVIDFSEGRKDRHEPKPAVAREFLTNDFGVAGL